MKKTVLVLSCEHAVNTIPELYRPLFASCNDLLNSHRGIDFGTASLAAYLQKNLEFRTCVSNHLKASHRLQ